MMPLNLRTTVNYRSYEIVDKLRIDGSSRQPGTFHAPPFGFRKMSNPIVDLALILAVPFLAAVILTLANEIYYRSLGRYRRNGVLITGAVGTPVHELAHALMAILFGMKVKKIAFYAPDPVSNTLGYVDYSYYPARFSHKVGLVFVGLAPLIIGSYVVVVAFALSGLPNLHSFTGFNNLNDIGGAPFWRGLVTWMQSLLTSTDSLMSGAVLLVALMVGSHATPSRADLKGSMGGAVAVLALLMCLWGLQSIWPAMHDAIGYYLRYGLFHVSTAIIQLAALSTFAGLILAVVGMGFRVLSAKFSQAEPKLAPAEGTPE